jgi:choline dehydrogenase-like flavoprotein
MGSDGPAVVGPDLRLRGIEGLRVCDSAALPAIPSSNTNAPVIMLAEKAADHIRGGPLLAAALLPPEAAP